MSIEQNKELVRRSVAGFYNRENLAVVDEVFAADYVGHDPHGFKAGGIEQVKELMEGMYAAFPDFHLHIDELIAEGDKVVKRWTVRFTHTGEYMGSPPTGKAITFSGTDTYRIAGGKLVENWASADWLSMMQQLGVTPPPG